jgi:hypothetical protein
LKEKAILTSSMETYGSKEMAETLSFSTPDDLSKLQCSRASSTDSSDGEEHEDPEDLRDE